MVDMMIMTAAVIGALVVIFCGVLVVLLETVRKVTGIWWRISTRRHRGGKRLAKEKKEGGPADVVAERIDREELLCQLAEEAAELAKAALKLRRVYVGTTDKSEWKGRQDLMEEMADTLNCVKIARERLSLPLEQIGAWESYKMYRWAERARQCYTKGVEDADH